jgi:molybdate transport system ATP-binding protein
MIELSNVDNVKSGKKLFRGFNWKINTNEHWVVDGPNGGGKTTLLEILSGKHVQSGSVHYDFITGSTWEEQFEQKRKLMQYIPAHATHALLPANSEMYYQQRYYSIGDEISIVKVRDILKSDVHHFQALELPPTFDLEPLLDREVKRLSNGQLKKVLILQRLLHHLPKLLLLDYPFEGLDKNSRKDFCDFVDFIVSTYSIQVVIVDNGNELPKCMTHRLTLDDFQISKQTSIDKRESISIPQPGNDQIPTTITEAIVDIRNLKIQYGDTVILNDFNWTVRRGDRWALIGSNGSGKTTLFSIIFADHPMAYSQEVYLFGKRRGTGESIWDIKRRVNYLGPELISYLDVHTTTRSAREYIFAEINPASAVNSVPGSKANDSQKLNELIRFFEADTFIDKQLKHLSSGQLQLTLLIGCFMSNKELLLLDEPFQFLDPHIRDRVADYLQQYLSGDITLILITHYERDLARWTEKTMKI